MSRLFPHWCQCTRVVGSSARSLACQERAGAVLSGVVGAVLCWLALVLVLAVAPPRADAASNEAVVRVTPVPEWVVVEPLDFNLQPPEGETRDGIYYLLTDEQRNAAEQAVYGRYARKFFRGTGIEAGSSVEIVYDPDYQTLEVHHVDIVRDGRRIPKLDAGEFRLVQRETGLRSNVYNGSVSAVLFVGDVRIGDAIEYSFTVRGANPVFGGRFIDSFSCGWPDPLARLHQRVLLPPGRRIFSRNHGGTTLKPVSRQLENGWTEVVWRADDIPGILADDDVPDWCDVFPWVELSEFADWTEVAVWGFEIYNSVLGESGEGEVSTLAAQFRAASNDPVEQALAAVRFIQDEVRYLGLHNGMGSHRPERPDVVLDRRYGDCKDKSLTLCALLREMDIPAWPALVDTEWRGRVDRRHPSPYAFDHVIVCLEVAGRRVWIDPTASDQGGGLFDADLPDFGRALLLKPGTVALSEIGRSQVHADRTQILEEFTVPPSRFPVEFVSSTRYSGKAADRIRAYFKDTPRTSVERGCLNFYASLYPDIDMTHPMEISDDRKANRIFVVERYRIGAFWSVRDGWRFAEFYPKSLGSELDRPELIRRRFPYAVAHPRFVQQTIVVNLPGPWELEPGELNVRNGTFRFDYSARVEGSRLILSHEYETFSDHVPVNSVAGFVRDIEAVYDAIGYEIAEPMPPALNAIGQILDAVSRSGKTESGATPDVQPPALSERN